MAASEDINTLFRRFGGNAGGYQEIVSRDQADSAEHKWPLLSQIRPFLQQEAPSTARDMAEPGVRVAQAPEPLRECVVMRPPEATPAPPLPVEEPGVQVQPLVVEAPVAMPGVVPVVSAPPVVAAVPVSSPAPESAAPAGSELQRMFGRMVPARAPQGVPEAVHPLKRLVKW
jgi:hypothetical protein